MRLSLRTDTGYDDGTNMIPAERGLVNLSESETTALIGISDVCLKQVGQKRD